MARMTNKKKAESVRELWQKAASNERQKWRSINQRGYDFYLNDQLTAQERDAVSYTHLTLPTILRV